MAPGLVETPTMKTLTMPRVSVRHSPEPHRNGSTRRTCGFIQVKSSAFCVTGRP